ncbi:MAG: putative exonuclease of the beta-lactamase fold involved in RNA processing [Candidatus Uhrbacteria bacterium GW2011_GWE2_45_35]|uniref:Putative exonuclease of the beta-lactamase fold involved in RNA processing n=2 Tax=Candidatus Uhriibacteriota TaxID=1752732 RepID=A0A0G1JK25_9BACT|nr:MAG: putative exonuclease of the beta-lactamase fold involved in RNA processing [Candidatus Uhrbacteria bacterium GW2011_GWF2_44_350]KKU08540.1 MAG: putative exonuclease of the beta-lactamase fold involved in RNA processing [Candidatus Uhrbacteria bacterium GW2011_GWE2_45_35]HBR80045.1 MBL fold hydrolase [Candidatus Uhrbacteria bacterium]HCU31136.1 MBL fold hydrolase [Candidatus Uhrbacteria bacterium]
MKISFFGAAREVTGSCFLFEANDSNGVPKKILIDCGMFQGEKFAEEKNREAFAFDPKSLDAVFVTHAHLDHTGRLPKLLHDGYSGSFRMTVPTCALTRIVLEDAYHIMEENARRSGEEVFYTFEDVKAVYDNCLGLGFHEQVEVAPGISVMFHDAGHILGSAYISIEAEGKRVVFSGDIGNDDVPILAPTEAVSKADVLVCESTYGHRVHENPQERTSLLRQQLSETLKSGGTLLIPSFSVERTQELLYELNNILLHDIKSNLPIFLDSPMAIRATEMYRHFKTFLQFEASIFSDPDRDFFSFPNLRETISADESKFINVVHPPKIIIAGSGMMTGGRVMHHLIRVLPDKNSTVLIIGYQAKGSLGRRIYEGAKQVKIFGQQLLVEAQVKAIGAFSAHGDQNKLTRWVQPEDGKLPKIFLVHGDPEVQDIFATHLRHELQAEVLVPEPGESFEV